MSTPRRYISDQRDAAARQTRTRILDAAEQELIRHGYHAMTIASLARAADVSPQTIYNSVGGKAAVVKALYDVRLAGDDEPVPMGQRPNCCGYWTCPMPRRPSAPTSPSGAACTAGSGRSSVRCWPTVPAPTLTQGVHGHLETERRVGNTSIVEPPRHPVRAPGRAFGRGRGRHLVGRHLVRPR